MRNSTAAPGAAYRSRNCRASIRVALSSPVDSRRTMLPTSPRCYPTAWTARAGSSRRRGSRTTLKAGALSPMQNVPDSRGHFGQFGGKYVAETLMPALFELERAYKEARRDPKFRDELEQRSREFVGRPTPLYLAANLTAQLGGAKIYLKREDLCHTGAHKVNNTLGQALLAVRMNKSRITTETGAGPPAVATAPMAPRFRRECEGFMGSGDVERQSLNVFRIKLLGPKVHPLHAATPSLQDSPTHP